MRGLTTRAPGIATALVTLCFSAASLATEREFLARFAGSFSGGGTVQRNASERPNQVTCTITGQPSATSVSMNGKCGAAIFSRAIKAEIHYDAATGRYTGVYVGSAIGPAHLSGKRKGDAVV